MFKTSIFRETWQIRNDSSNVAALLNPLHSTSKRNCYCIERNISPQLFSRPLQCVYDDDSSDESYKIPETYKKPTHKKLIFVNKSRERPRKEFTNSKSAYFDTESDFSEVTDKRSRSSKKIVFDTRSSRSKKSQDASTHCRSAYFDSEDDSSPETGKTYKIKSGRKNSNYDQSRYSKKSNKPRVNQSKLGDSDKTKVNQSKYLKDSDISRFSQSKYSEESDKSRYNQSKYLRDSDKSRVNQSQYLNESDKSRFNQSKYPEDYSESEKPTINQTKYSYENDEDFANSSPETSQTKLQNLSDFRKDHYFETHSTEDLIKAIPPHVCVYKFTLDDRQLPSPLNSDVYGANRCIICDKPMENPVVSKIDEREKPKSVFPKFYKYGFAPKRIYMGGSSQDKIEMILDESDDIKKKQATPNYYNTYALRYQKGVKL